MKLVLLRHGESVWNRENRFTGWVDVDLSEQGVEEARQAGRLLKQEGYSFDIVYTSVLQRAVRTLEIVEEELGVSLPVEKSWRLNERHYGALQGLNKSEMAMKYGEEQVRVWRRSYDVRPPALKREDPMWPGHDPQYASLKKSDIPVTECLKDTVTRVVPYWEQVIAPQLRRGKRALIVAHGNSLRALVKHLENVPDAEITELNIPTGFPLVYELDDNLQPVTKYYLGDPAAIATRIRAVAAQGKKG